VTSFNIPSRDRLLWLGVDLDGTLAEEVWPDTGIGEPIRVNVTKLKEAVRVGYKAVIHTSRSWESYELIESWLEANDVPFSRIVCGKVLCAAYIDNKAISSTSGSWLPARHGL
jgi:hypothetical protein